MVDLKLSRLPDRTPVRIVISIPPALHANLTDYAAAYALAYDTNLPVAELIPAMLAAFIESDRGFARSQGQAKRTQA